MTAIFPGSIVLAGGRLAALFFRADGTLASGAIGGVPRAEIVNKIKVIKAGGKE